MIKSRRLQRATQAPSTRTCAPDSPWVLTARCLAGQRLVCPRWTSHCKQRAHSKTASGVSVGNKQTLCMCFLHCLRASKRLKSTWGLQAWPADELEGGARRGGLLHTQGSAALAVLTRPWMQEMHTLGALACAHCRLACQ